MEGWGELGRMRRMQCSAWPSCEGQEATHSEAHLSHRAEVGKEKKNIPQTYMLNKDRHYAKPCVFKHTLRSDEGQDGEPN